MPVTLSTRLGQAMGAHAGERWRPPGTPMQALRGACARFSNGALPPVATAGCSYAGPACRACAIRHAGMTRAPDWRRTRPPELERTRKELSFVKDTKADSAVQPGRSIDQERRICML